MQTVYDPRNDHSTCYFVCGAWDEPVPLGRVRVMLATLLRPFGYKPKVRKWRRRFGNDMIDVHPLIFAFRMQSQRRMYAVIESREVPRKLYRWYQDIQTAMMKAEVEATAQPVPASAAPAAKP